VAAKVRREKSGMNGILAVWNDRSEAIKLDYERWYMNEHIPERLAVPGFRTARRYEAIDADRAFFTYYEVDSPDVLIDPVYTDLLANPTPLTRSIMPHFYGMVRSVFVEVVREGGGIGGALVVARYMNSVPASLPRAALEVVDRSEIASAKVWQSAPANVRTDTPESRTRPGPDAVANGAIVVETMREAAALALAMSLKGKLTEAGVSIGCYRLLCAYSN
jgi:hypothetical protein